MKLKRILLLLITILSFFTLTSCSLLDLLTYSVNEETETTYPDLGNYYQDLDPITPNLNYKLLTNSYSTDAVPSTGQINLLVIPIEFLDYTFSDAGYSSYEVLYSDLRRLFNGSDEDTGYFSSVRNFYYYSSYQKFFVTFEIGEVVSANLTTKELLNYTASSSSEPSSVDSSSHILNVAVNQYKSAHGQTSTQKFDNDKDGLIDGVMLIYSAPNSNYDRNFSNYVGDDGDLYWAYCYWDQDNAMEALYYAGKSGYRTKDELLYSPIPSTYFWASYDFMYEYSSCEIGGKVDAHTYIHEFGHMLGLDDYYSYDDYQYKDDSYSYVGYADMMEGNIYDHNAYSKMTLGWINPYVVTGDATITIRPSSLYGDCIILADDYNGTAFDEYIMIELFTNDGMNKQDSTVSYGSGYPICFTEPGVKIFHVDSRIVRKTSTTQGYHYTDSTKVNLDYIYRIGQTNSYSRDVIEGTDFDLIKLIHQDKSTGCTQSSSKFIDDSSYYGENKHLFHEDDEFSLADYKDLFPNQELLNNGNSLDYTITIKSLSSDSATIEFVRN